MRCNLKCRLCGVLVPQYDYRPQMTLDEFAATLKAIFELANSIGKLQITGGEPLLHTELADMLEECFEYKPQFDKLWLFTNCAVLMKSAVLDVLASHKDKVYIHMSDYGARREITEGLLRQLDGAGIEYRYLKYFGDEQYFNGWVDQGDFVKHERSNEENEAIFYSCSHVKRGGSWYVRGGQMHLCGRSIRGTEVGRIPLRDEDYLDIFNGTVVERREKLHRLTQSEYILACDYCNGEYGTEDLTKRHPAGEQDVTCRKS
ncbi:MAG: hypothetical protein LBL26_02370 [Peptococcaceae bacterium]|nr:hypothetical protein [Peptococcaceae bacterium]